MGFPLYFGLAAWWTDLLERRGYALGGLMVVFWLVGRLDLWLSGESLEDLGAR